MRSTLADRVSLALVMKYLYPRSSHTALAADVLPIPGVPDSKAQRLLRLTLPEDLESKVKSTLIARQFCNHMRNRLTAELLPMQSTLFLGLYLSTQSGVKFELGLRLMLAKFFVKFELGLNKLEVGVLILILLTSDISLLLVSNCF